MKSYKVVLLPAADDDLDDIFNYILLDNQEAVIEVLKRVTYALKHLEEFPHAGLKVVEDSLNHFKFRMVITEPYIAFIVLLKILYILIEYCMGQEITFKF